MDEAMQIEQYPLLRKKVALYDIDNTSYQGFLVEDLVLYQYQKGTLSQHYFDAIQYDLNLCKAGQLPYEEMAENVLCYWAEGLYGQRVDQLLFQTEDFFRKDGRKFFSFVQASIDFLRPSHDTYFVTAEPQFVAQVVRQLHQGAGYISTVFDARDGIFTGEVSLSLAKSTNKREAITDVLMKHGREQSIAFGDSEGDEDMLASVEHAICVQPRPGLHRVAKQKGWHIAQPESVMGILENVRVSHGL